MRTLSAGWVVAIVIGGFGMAACGSSSPSPSTSPSTSTPSTTSTSTSSNSVIAPAAALATGAYVPAGTTGMPHYVVTIGSAEGTKFGGALHFVYQDGTTSNVFEFSGTVTGQRAVATPTSVATPGSATKTVSAVPSELQIDLGADTLTFSGCQAYLPQVHSSSACTFIGSR